MAATATRLENDGDCSNAARLAPRAAIPFEDREIFLGEAFRLASGEALRDPVFRIRLFGPEGAPVIAVAGGISAGRKACDAGDGAGWWRDLAGPGCVVDTDRYRVLAFDFLPGDEGEVRTIEAADQARALAIALRTLGVFSLHAFVGASYGGFVGLAFAERYPAFLERLCVISAAAQSDPMTTALRGVQRRIIAFAAKAGRAEEGVSLARQLAMTTYRSEDEFRNRFESAALGPRAGDLFDVCGYLKARGDAYAHAMPAWRYITLSDSLDRARINPAQIETPALCIAASTDRLVPAHDTREMAEALAGAADYYEIDSSVGHDAFLCDVALYEERLFAFLEGRRRVENE